MSHSVHIARSSLSLPSPVTSPLTLLDPYEMADLIRGTMTRTDAAIVAHIAAQNMSGNDFLHLRKRGLRTLSNNDDQVFQELRKLQKIPSDAIPSLSSPILRSRDWGLPSIFPELTPLIQNHGLPDVPEGFSAGADNMNYRNDDVGSSATLDPRNSENFSYEAFDYGDDDAEVEHTFDLHATVTEVVVPDRSLQPALENGTPVASTLEQADVCDALINDSSPQNGNLATAPAKDGAIHSVEETHNAELQSSDKPDEASTHELDESHLLNPLGSQSTGGSHEDDTHLQSDCVLVGPDFCTPSARSSPPSLFYVCDDPDAATQLSQIPPHANVPNPQTTLDPTVLTEQDSPSNLLTRSLEHSMAPVTEGEKALELPRLPASEPAATLSSLECSLLSLTPFLESLSMPDGNPNSNTCFDVNEELNGQTYETSQSSNISEDAPDGTVREVDLPRSNKGSKDLRDSFTSAHDSIESKSCQSSPPPSPASSESPLDSEPSAVLLLNRPQSVNADIQTTVSSSTNCDETLEDPIVDSEVSSIESESPSWPSTPARLEDHHDLNFDEVSQSKLQFLQDTVDNLKQPNVDMNSPVISTHSGAFTLPVDIIPVTPPGSPFLEGLSHYMLFQDSEAPDNISRADQNNTSTPVQRDTSTGERTLWPPSEAPRFGLLSSSGNGQLLRSDLSQPTSSPLESPRPGPNADIAVQPDTPCPHHLSHIQVRDSYLGMSTLPFERMQSGLWHVIPTLFALDRETINRTSHSATDRGL